MAITDLLQQGQGNAILMVGATELKEFCDNLIDEAVARFTPQQEEVYLTTAQASNKLNVNRSTLWRWDRDNYLKSVKVGKKTLYRLSDVEKILN